VINIKDAYYFSHDSNAHDDPKCVLLIEQLGLEGYGIYWMLIETLREQPEYIYPVSLLSALARRFNTSPEKMKEVVTSYNLFDVNEKGFFYSNSLNKRMEHYEYKRELSRMGGKKSAEKRNLLNTSSALEPHLSCTSTSIVKKSIVNETKEKKNIADHNKQNVQEESLAVKIAAGINNTFIDHSTTLERFSEFWKAYPKKVGKGAAEKSFGQHKPNKELLCRMLIAITKQVKTEQWLKNNGKYIPNPATWLNQRRWEDEDDAKYIRDTEKYEIVDGQQYDKYGNLIL
jgi:hypothetical protein